MRTGIGVAIPLPRRLAETLGLTPGRAVRVEGPDAEGAIRIVPADEAGARAPVPPPRQAPKRTPTPPTPGDVARAVSGPGAAPAEPPEEEREGITRELDRLVERHGDTLREVER